MAVYVPPGFKPWDDAVTLALEYAEIPYEKLWDEEVLQGKLSEYDWLHLHHEDFTGQYGKFYASFASASLVPGATGHAGTRGGANWDSRRSRR